jgi:hypothetical protein
MMPDSLFYSFSGDANTYIGAVALFATPVILFWIFRSYYHSPLNLHLKNPNFDSSDNTEDHDAPF